MATRITPLPTPVPQSSDPQNFDQRADQFLTALPTFADEANQAAEEMDEAVDTAQAAASASLSNASFVGRWEDQSGPAAPPYSVFHGGLFWSLLEQIADVTSSEPDPYNTQWAVTGAPAWYNNFAVGDYLDTARSPGAGWLRRDGAPYLISVFPELAPLMLPIPASFAFVSKETGTTETLFDITLVDGRAFAGPIGSGSSGTSKVIEISEAGDNWEVVELSLSQSRDLRASRPFGMIGSSFVFPTSDSHVFYGTNLDQTLNVHQVDDNPSSPQIAFSPTAAVYLGRKDGSAILKRATVSPTSWSTVANPAGLGTESTGNLSYAKNRFLFTYGSSLNYAVSLDDGASFVTRDNSSVGANFGFIAEANNKIFGVNISNSPVYDFALLDDDITSAQLIDLSAIGWVNVTCIAYLDGVYVIGKSWTNDTTNTLAYSIDLETWHPIHFATGVPIRDLAVVGDKVVAVGEGGLGASGFFIPSEYFRVPSDNPETGWIKAASDSPGTVGYDGVPEAPLTGGPFGRQGGAWVGMEGGGSVNADWNATEGPAEILNKPTIPSSPGGGFVGTEAAQTLTNKTLGAGSKEAVDAVGTVTINDAATPFQTITLTQNRTATISLAEGVSRTIWVNPGTYTLTWPAGTVWAGGSAPTLPASKWSLITFTGMPGNAAGIAALVGSQP